MLILMPKTLTRRNLLTGAIASGVLLHGRSSFGKAAQPATPVDFDVPAHACDCHTHIIGEPTMFPLAADRAYTPETAKPDEMAAFHKALHIERVVLVTPSVYDTDNSAMLYGMKARGKTARGVAVIGEKTSDSELENLHRAGVRGIRINLATTGENDPALARTRFQTDVARVKGLKWHIQMFTNLAVIGSIKDLVAGSPVPVVFDHFGGADAALGVNQPGFSDLLDLVRGGHAYVKLSGVYRVSKEAPDYKDATPLAKALIAANQDRMVWGSDWPHTRSTPKGHKNTELTTLTQVDDGLIFNQLPLWAPDPAVRTKILATNPARLYDF